MGNPFEYGRELSATEIVDRVEELGEVVQTIRDRGRLFMIGPRRFGKTSILRAASEIAENEGYVVLRYNAEAFPTLQMLAERIVADGAKRLTGPVRKAGKKLQDTFSSVRPRLTYDPVHDTFSVSLAGAAGRREEPALLAETLDGLDTLAATWKGTLAVVIDEFQKVVEDGGIEAERQIRAAVQSHSHVGYVFAGSKTRMISEMTSDESRPFYRLGSRMYIGPVPREDFRAFLRAGFQDNGLHIEDVAIEAILDTAEDVPYNVQRLAHECWARGGATDDPVTAGTVEEVLETLVRREDPFYTQIWNRLNSTQQKALLAVVDTGGSGVYSAETIERFGVKSSSTMRTAIKALTSAGIVREHEQHGSLEILFEDPFMKTWLKAFVASP